MSRRKTSVKRANKKKASVSPTLPPIPSTDVRVEKDKAVASFTDKGIRALMAELAADRFARVIRQNVLSGEADGKGFTILLPDASEFDRLKQFAAQVASMERGACLDLAKGIVAADQHEQIASEFASRGPLGFTVSVRWEPETKVWLAK